MITNKTNEEIIEQEIIKIIESCFDDGDNYISYAEDVLFENSDIKGMLYTPRGIYLGTKDKILETIKGLLISRDKQTEIRE